MIDLHLHPGMTDFFPTERTEAESRARILNFLEEYRKAGFETVRDAGFFDKYTDLKMPGVERCAGVVRSEEFPQLQPAKWIKIIATGGVGCEPEKVKEPVMSRDVFLNAVKRSHEMGYKVMVHCWGGVSLDWCIEAGVDSVEHGMYLTKDQALRMAEAQVPLVPTTSIYRILADRPEVLDTPENFSEHAKRAADSHLKTVRWALEAGVLIGYGTDFFSDPALLPFAGYELQTLQDCGLTRRQAEESATVSAEKILRGRQEQ